MKLKQRCFNVGGGGWGWEESWVHLCQSWWPYLLPSLVRFHAQPGQNSVVVVYCWWDCQLFVTWLVPAIVGEHMDMVAVKARLTHLFWDWQAFLRVVIPGLWSWVISTLAGHLGPIIRHALFNNTSASRIRGLGEDKWLLSHAPLPINKLLNVVVSIFASCGFALNESHYSGGSSNTAGVFSRWEIVFLGCVFAEYF